MRAVGWLLLLTAVPGAITGALFASEIEEDLGDPILIGVMLIVFGTVLLLIDRLPGSRFVSDFRFRDAAIMGVAQALALQPGVSRSGVTMTAGRWLRFDRAAAARLSFLMSIPIIAGAGLYKGAEVASDGFPSDFAAPFFWGFVASAVSGFIAIVVADPLPADEHVLPVRRLPLGRRHARHHRVRDGVALMPIDRPESRARDLRLRGCDLRALARRLRRVRGPHGLPGRLDRAAALRGAAARGRG